MPVTVQGFFSVGAVSSGPSQPQAAFEDNACEVSSNDACEVSSNASTACEIAEPQAAPKASEYKLYTPQPQAAPESNAFKLFAPQPQPRGLKPGPMDYCRPCPVKQDTTKVRSVAETHPIRAPDPPSTCGVDPVQDALHTPVVHSYPHCTQVDGLLSVRSSKFHYLMR